MRATVPALLLLLTSAAGAQTPEQQVESLLAADRSFAAAAAHTDLVNGLAAMFAPDVISPAPGGVFLEGIEAVTASLRGNPANHGARATWTPIRGGISADGLHGFTFGYMDITRGDSTRTFAKYMAYWVKRPEGWRVQVYKRSPREGVAVSTALLAPAVPDRMVAVVADSAVIERHRASLAAAERAFSDEAQRIGLGAAFAKHGSEDAVNMGPPAGPYVLGAAAIGRSVGGDGPTDSSPVHWAADHRVIVASSGDLGITMGLIHRHDPGADPRPPFAFFTIWRRASADAPWRYVAE